MIKPLSVDLRERVVVAVDGGPSRRKAAERIEAYAPVILAVVDRKADITLAKFRDLLAQQRGGGGDLDAVALLRPPEDHAEKSPGMRRSRTVLTS